METYQLIIKSQPTSEDARSFLQPNYTFEKGLRYNNTINVVTFLPFLEVQMYSSVFVDMSNYVKSQGVLPSSYHESEIVDIPKCFYAHWSGEEGQTKEDMIIMENLLQQGFVFRENGDQATNKVHVEMVMREIAKFHAISYCMKVRIIIDFYHSSSSYDSLLGRI